MCVTARARSLLTAQPSICGGLKEPWLTMRTFKLKLVIFVSFLLGFAACANEEARLISTTCGALKRYFALSKDDYIKCLGDEVYRQSLVSFQDTQWSQSISESHNRKLVIMLPK